MFYFTLKSVSKQKDTKWQPDTCNLLHCSSELPLAVSLWTHYDLCELAWVTVSAILISNMMFQSNVRFSLVLWESVLLLSLSCTLCQCCDTFIVQVECCRPEVRLVVVHVLEGILVCQAYIFKVSLQCDLSWQSTVILTDI